MPANFSDMEQSIILNMLTTKSHKAIALLLDRDIKEVSEYISFLTEGSDMVTWQMKLEADPIRKPMKVITAEIKVPKPAKVKLPGKKADAEKERLREVKDQKKRNQVERLNVEADRRNLRRLPGYKTKEVDYSKLITVMINRTTAIYVKPGTDIKAAKELYLAKVEAQKISSIDRDTKGKKVIKPHKKTCIRCKGEKIIAEFDKNRGYPDGYENVCKTCKKNAKKIKAQENHFTL